MKRLLILLLFPLMMFAQDSTLVGDVDCSGEVNSQDASLILQFVTNVIDELPCEANMTGLTPDQLQEMIDMMDEQLSINYSAGSGGGCDYDFPQGRNGTPFVWSFINGDYTVPLGKTLYMLIAGNWLSDVIVSGDTIDIGYPNHRNLIFEEGTVIIDDNSPGTFNGLLLDKSLDVTPITYSFASSGSPFTVPLGKILYISLVNNWNPIEIDLLGSVIEFPQPGENGVILPSQTVMSSTGSPSASFNGYLVDEDYFADCSGGGGSTTNSVTETDGIGVDFLYPEGLEGLIPVSHNFLDGDYVVQSGKNLYINHLYQYDPSDTVKISGLPIFKGIASFGSYYYDYSQDIHQPILATENDIISSTTNGDQASFNGFLIDKNIEFINHLLDPILGSGDTYTVPDGKLLVVLNLFTEGNSLYYGASSVEGFQLTNGYFNNYSTGNTTSGVTTLSNPLLITENETISSSSGIVFNGYLVDEDYFSSAGSGSNSNVSDGTMSVSTFGDTLTLNGESIIVPGISYENTPSSIFGTVTDIDGNVYQTVNILGREWMMESLRTSTFSNGDIINEVTETSNDEDGGYCAEPGYRTVEINNSGISSLVDWPFDFFYNGHAVNDSRNICPDGWHVATVQDYSDVLNLFGDMLPYGNGFGFYWENAGGALKKENANWTYYYPDGFSLELGTNESYLGLLRKNSGDCAFVVNPAYGNAYTPKLATSSSGNWNGNWVFELRSDDNRATFSDEPLYHFFQCRCVKD